MTTNNNAILWTAKNRACIIYSLDKDKPYNLLGGKVKSYTKYSHSLITFSFDNNFTLLTHLWTHVFFNGNTLCTSNDCLKYLYSLRILISDTYSYSNRVWEYCQWIYYNYISLAHIHVLFTRGFYTILWCVTGFIVVLTDGTIYSRQLQQNDCNRLFKYRWSLCRNRCARIHTPPLPNRLR